MAYPTGELSVDLHAIAENWKYIQSNLGNTTACGAVVKANAYGLGVERVAPRIYQAGCRDFFVANLKEAIQLQSLIGRDVRVFVLAGCIAGAEKEFINRSIIPVIVSTAMLRRWAACVADHPQAEAALKINTGMGRLGLEPAEFEALLDEVELLKAANISWLMSHFACADEPDHSLNKIQIARFHAMTEALHERGLPVRTSLANSAGVFLGQKAQSDLVRPGISLYGGNPGLAKNPMYPVVGLQLPVIQVRDLPAGEYVGYGATRHFSSPRKIATVAGGYADGIMRSLSNKGWGWLAGAKVPIVGRVSMDSTMFDITDSPAASQVKEGDAIELLGEHVSIDELADAAGTISYEILTSFGPRYQRCYID